MRHFEINDSSTFEQIESRAKRWHKTKLKGRKPKDLAELIYRIISRREATIFVTNGNVQCSAGRSRSAEDVLRIARYYKPNIKLETVVNSFKELYKDCVYPSYCGDVKRLVHHIKNYNKDNELSFRAAIKEYNIKF